MNLARMKQMEEEEHTASEVAEAKRWGFNDVAAWKDAMRRSGMLQDMGYEEGHYAEENDC